MQAVINKVHWCVAFCAVNCAVDGPGHRSIASYWSRIAICTYPPAFDASVRGSPLKYCQDVWYEKIEWLVTTGWKQRTEFIGTQRSGKSEAEVTNNRRLRLTYCTTEANYWQTWSIARLLCDSSGTCSYRKWA